MASQFGFNLGGASRVHLAKLIFKKLLLLEELLKKRFKRGIIDGEEDLLINHHIAFNNLRKKMEGTNIENLYFFLIEKSSPCSTIVL